MAQRSIRGAVEIEAELSAPGVQVQLVQYHFTEAPDGTMRVDDKIRIELCFTSRHRSARACFVDQWNSHRFEQIGEMFVLPPAQSMRARSDEESSLTSVVCELDLQPVLEMFDSNLPELHEQHLLTSLDVRNTKIHAMLLSLAMEVRYPGFASGLLVEAVANQIQIELFRNGGTVSEHKGHGGLAPWQMRLINERVQDIREAPTLVELAALCRISVRHLTRGFRTSYGSSIGAYVANCQMRHARHLLVTDQSVATIASDLGFSSSSNFCFAFRRAMGVTPGQFRATLLCHPKHYRLQDKH